MKFFKSLRIRSRIVLSAVRRGLSKYTTSKAVRRDSTSGKTCACSAQCATTKFITYPVKLACQKDKCSMPRDFVIRFTGRPERWPAFVIVMVWLMVVSLFLAGHLIVEGIVFLIGRIT
jgi:hypothetical protein